MGLLISHFYMTPPLLDVLGGLAKRGVPTMLDSGGFSAHFSGKPADVDVYIDFCKRHGRIFTQYVQLDKIKDDAMSRLWLQKQYDAGLTPMPVFTVGANEDDFGWFLGFSRRICVAGWAYFGNPQSWGMGNSSNWGDATAAYERRVHRLWASAGGNVRMHGLSFTTGIRCWKSRVWSVDSSSWTSGHRYGTVSRFSPETGILSLKRQDYTKPGFAKKHPTEMRRLNASGIVLSDFTDMSKMTSPFSLLSMLSTEAWLSYVTASRAHGVTMFLAASNVRDVSVIAIAAKNKLVGGGVDWKSAMEQSEWLLANNIMKKSPSPECIDYIIDGLSNALADPSRSAPDAPREAV